jgi:uncharacterized membrane protein YedE/YeeE
MKGLQILGLTFLAACFYGIVQDQVTARVCLEYFTVAHEPVPWASSPTLVALAWGFKGTWPLGLLLGVALALSARLGSSPKLEPRELLRPIGKLLLAMVLLALVCGIAGYFHAKVTGATPGRLASLIAPERHALFFADWRAHQAAYLTGFSGSIVLCIQTVRRRLAAGRLPAARAPASTAGQGSEEK